mmetsp:Transcript_45507/g.99105  ORF Transcript_45507/g.99105 Transcript_45507/m.99105 type:complete len:220 (-) Transcript_45507:133-792(-)
MMTSSQSEPTMSKSSKNHVLRYRFMMKFQSNSTWPSCNTTPVMHETIMSEVQKILVIHPMTLRKVDVVRSKTNIGMNIMSNTTQTRLIISQTERFVEWGWSKQPFEGACSKKSLPLLSSLLSRLNSILCSEIGGALALDALKFASCFLLMAQASKTLNLSVFFPNWPLRELSESESSLFSCAVGGGFVNSPGGRGFQGVGDCSAAPTGTHATNCCQLPP